MDKKQICAFFGCTQEQLQTQYKANAEILATMRNKAIRTGKKVGNYTADQLTVRAAKYKELAK